MVLRCQRYPVAVSWHRSDRKRREDPATDVRWFKSQRVAYAQCRLTSHNEAQHGWPLLQFDKANDVGRGRLPRRVAGLPDFGEALQDAATAGLLPAQIIRPAIRTDGAGVEDCLAAVTAVIQTVTDDVRF